MRMLAVSSVACVSSFVIVTLPVMNLLHGTQETTSVSLMSQDLSGLAHICQVHELPVIKTHRIKKSESDTQGQ